MTRNMPLILIIQGLLFVIIISSCNKDERKTNQPPTCKITSPTVGQEIAIGEKITISVAANDNDGNLVEVSFFINDEEKKSVVDYPYNYIWNTTGENIGNHTIKATSVDNNGDSSDDEVTFILTEDGGGNSIKANFTANVTSGRAPLSINFTDLSTSNPISWKWDFGDSDTNTQQNPTHTYNTDGYYTVTLLVNDPFNSDTKTKTNYIYIGSGGVDGEPCPGTPTVSDADGNMYNTVLIDSRCWMKENLRVGTRIKGKYDMTDNSVIEKYCYNDISANCLTYGALYQWDEMMQYNSQPGSQGICPESWHIPSDDEWKQLEIYLGMSQSQVDKVGYRGTDEGNKLKSDGGWNDNGYGSNIVGFSALPGGYHHNGNSYREINYSGSWWSSSEHRSIRVWRRGLYHNNAMVRRNHHDKTDALSVRCVKD